MNIKWIFPLLAGLLLLAACTTAPAAVTETVGLATDMPLDASPVETTVEPVVEDTDTTESVVDASDPAGLAYVREEEKLARDVYLFLYERWGLQIFQNIAGSEQTHTDAIQNLLSIYGLDDPAAGAQPGTFRDASLQALYDQLTSLGSQSLADALKVGGAIEEIDILDLQARLAGTIPDDVRLVYENLLAGSCNHLSAFTSTLERQTGEVYVPQYMTDEAYQEALNSGSIGGIGNGYGRQGGKP